MKAVAVVLLVLTAATCFGQQPVRPGVQLSAGPSLWLYDYNTQSEKIWGATGSVKYNFINLNPDLALNILLKPSAGYHPQTRNDQQQSFLAEIPVLLEMSIGHVATKDFHRNFGFAAGAGQSFYYFKDGYNHSHILSAALRFIIFGQSFNARYISYLPLKDENELRHAISLELNFGAYLAITRANNKLTKFNKPYRK